MYFYLIVYFVYFVLFYKHAIVLHCESKIPPVSVLFLGKKKKTSNASYVNWVKYLQNYWFCQMLIIVHIVEQKNSV